MKSILKTIFIISIMGAFVSCKSSFDATETMEIQNNREAVYKEIISNPEQLNEFMDLAQNDEEARKVMMQTHMQMMESGKMKQMMKKNPDMKEKMKVHMQKMMEEDSEMREKMYSRMMEKMMKNQDSRKMLMKKIHENPEMKHEMMEKMRKNPKMMEEMMEKMMTNPEMREKMKSRMGEKKSI